MLRKSLVVIVSGLLLVNIYGCFALLAGGAAGAGTAVWLSEKLTQQVNAPFERTVSASKSALASLRLEVTKETIEDGNAQIMSKYTDGKTIWIDIHRVTLSSSKIEVRVGAMGGDKAAAEKILKEITRRL
ncbi:MAG: DUF3568 family protein [Candidatus Omnitrophota bacterium]|nr:DUF3568 family protein [Candidatus Omnitrophota bacterium]